MAFYADCLDLCGNAYDPSVYALWEGPHAVSFTQVMLEVVLAGDQAVNAAYNWREAISKAKGTTSWSIPASTASVRSTRRRCIISRVWR